MSSYGNIASGEIDFYTARESDECMISNNMSLLAKCLRSFYPVSYINNESIADIRECSFSGIDFCDINKECVYVVNEEVLNEQGLPGLEANFVVILPEDNVKFFEQIENCRKSNVIVIYQFDIVSICKTVENVVHAIKEMELYFNRLLSAVFEHDTPKQYINIVSEMVENPVLLLDENMCLVAYGDVKCNVGIKQIMENSICLSDQWKEHKIEYVEYPQIFTDSFRKNHLICTIQGNGHGQYILEVIEQERKICEKHYPMLIRASEIIKIWYKRNGKYRNREYQLYEFFADVISQKGGDRGWILRRASDLGIKLGKKNYLIMISRERNGTTYQELQDMYRRAKEKIASVAFLYDFSIYVLYESDDEELEKKISELIEEYRKDGWAASVSYEFSDVGGLYCAYQQCRYAEIFGYQLGSEEAVRDYQRFMPYHFYSNALSHLKSKEFILPLAKKMIEYDRINKSEYAVTIYQYLNTYKNINMTAKFLHVHRNTIIYRIEKAKEIFGLDYDDHALMNSLKMSLEIIRCDSSLFSIFC